MGFIERLTSLWRRGSPDTPSQEQQDITAHSTEEIRETDFIYRMLEVETSRRHVLRDVETLLRTDPLVDETNTRVSRKTVRGGIISTVKGSGKHEKQLAVKKGNKPGRGSQLANKAQEIIDDFFERCKVDAHSAHWVARLIADGDLFLNVLVRMDSQPYIEKIQQVPPAIMKRNEDQFGRFIDASRAFSEIDPQNGLYFTEIIPDTAVRHFPLWSINHIRWKYRGGQYGNSQYVTIRKLSKQNATADDDMVVRRKVRAPLRRAHILGSKDAPADSKAVDAYKKEHRESMLKGKYQPVTDYYMNGLGDVKNLEGDGNLDKIADIKYLYDKQNTGTIIPKGLIGHAEDINRDILDDQKEEYYDTIEDIRHLLEYGDGGPFSGLRAIIDFELLLHGIDVEATGLSYDINFRPLRTEDPTEVVNRTNAARKGGLIDLRTAVTSIAHIFQVEDVDLLLESLQQEKEQSQKEQAELMKGGDGNEMKEPPD